MDIMKYEDLSRLCKAAISDNGFKFSEHNYSKEDVNNLLRAQFNLLAPDYRSFRRNQNTIFELIEETLDDVLPAKVAQQYMDFADTQTIAQGDKAVFRQKYTEVAKKRAKTFITRVGLAGRYETFMLDGREITVETGAIGYAVRIGFEEFLDGRIDFSDLTSIMLEGFNEYIYAEVAKALASAVKSLPTANKAEVAGFDETTMDDLLGIADSYGRSAIYCTEEFARTMVPAEGWRSSELKNERWNNGYIANYKGHQVIILPQSMLDATNETKVIDPAQAYIIPVGAEKPVKIVFEGQTAVRMIEDNDDWSRDMQTYTKMGIAIIENNWMCSYRNTELTTASRHLVQP